jgi:hypothetical protein
MRRTNVKMLPHNVSAVAMTDWHTALHPSAWSDHDLITVFGRTVSLVSDRARTDRQTDREPHTMLTVQQLLPQQLKQESHRLHFISFRGSAFFIFVVTVKSCLLHLWLMVTQTAQDGAVTATVAYLSSQLLDRSQRHWYGLRFDVGLGGYLYRYTEYR